MKKKSIFILVGFVLFLLVSCPAVPRSLMSTAEVMSLSVDSGTINLDGYPPFTVEFYDNWKFEGSYSTSYTISSRNEYIFTPTPFVYGEPRYLRVKSAYGQWQPYSDDNGIPIMLMGTSGDQGDYTNPYIINTQSDLIALSNQDTSRYGTSPWSAGYVLANDIDLTGVDWKPIGTNVANRFKGLFNGNGHVISGLNSFDVSDDYAGFFGYSGDSLAYCAIVNLGLKIGDIECDVKYLGGLVGLNDSNGQIINCYVIGTSIKGGTDYTGGLVGYTKAGRILNDYTNINVEGKGNTGGLIGGIITGDTYKSFSLGEVIFSGESSAQVGGFIGYITPATIDFPENCISLADRVFYRAGSFPPNIYYFGRHSGTDIVGPNYYNKYINAPGGTSEMNVAIPVSAFAIPVNPYTMGKNTPPFDQWDFDDVWKWDDATNLPILRTVGN